jgi:glycopeptide antibiotics resistance protein
VTSTFGENRPRPGTGSQRLLTTTAEEAFVSARNSARTCLLVLFSVYVFLLAWIVLWKLDVPWLGGVQRVIKLVPFAPSAGSGASAPSEVVANLLLFIPFGVYLALLAPRWAWWRIAGVVAGASLVLEGAQYVLAIGSSDVTDILVNAAGGLAGFGLLTLARRRLRSGTTRVMTRVCSIGTVLAVLASGIIVASPLRHRPPSDVGVVSTHSTQVGAAVSLGSLG